MSTYTVLDMFREIERLFPDEADPDRYECLAFLHQRLAYRCTRTAEQLKAMRKEAARAGGGGER